ncbi:MAG: hypothetical protein GSR86_03845 [Desulfurococcales archaeon]|nr:hypothetical protein [Desulfurococcales archaeon]
MTGECREDEDIRELKEVLTAVSDFITDIGDKIKDILDSMMSALDGAKIGRETAELYKSLKEAGMPEEMAIQLTREFFNKKMELAPSISSIIEALKGSFAPWTMKGKASAEEVSEKIKKAVSNIEDEELKERVRRRIIESLKEEEEE